MFTVDSKWKASAKYKKTTGEMDWDVSNPGDRALLEGVMLSVVAGDYNQANKNSIMLKLDQIRSRTQELLDLAKNSIVLSVLQNAYSEKKAGKWSLTGRQADLIKGFVTEALNSSKNVLNNSSLGAPANDSSYALAA